MRGRGWPQRSGWFSLWGMNQPIVSVPSQKRPATRKDLDAVTTMFMLALLCVVGVVVAALWLRVRSSRRRLAAVIGVGEEGGQPAGKPRLVDPWTEAARRLEVRAVGDDDAETVDFDPGSLGPDDIEPGDEPRNGEGAH